MKKFVSLVGLLALISAGVFAQAKVYKVGDTGPAGGHIFYDKGNNDGGWRYLEAAPEEKDFKEVEWGRRGKDIPGTLSGVGRGKENSALIFDNFTKNKERAKQQDRAVQLCENLEFGGFDDWYLPSRDELNLMYENLKEKNIGGFSDNRYWSSTQNNKDEALAVAFGMGWAWIPIIPGSTHNNSKSDKHNVRPIRAF